MCILTQRWYNPVVGRFVMRDINNIEYNLFAYTHNNPANIVDPSGRFSVKSSIIPPDPVVTCTAYALALLRKWVNKLKRESYNDKYVHCVVSCELTKECGEDFARTAGILREAIQGFISGIRKWIRGKLINFRCYIEGIEEGIDVEDMVANEDGIKCGSWVQYRRMDCEKCCNKVMKYPVRK